MVKVLFVCLGNICRSPTADAILRKKVKDAGLQKLISVDSAGTAAWHTGKAPDERSTRHAALRGYDLSPLRARQVSFADFYEFDYVLAMDEQNLADLIDLSDDASTQPELFLKRFNHKFPETQVPDPYYGGDAGFEHVLDLLEHACDNLLAEIRQKHAL
ncbi:MAG: low molecular weight protein-tyrosine-phosphatase [Venatoribacter sp.]